MWTDSPVKPVISALSLTPVCPRKLAPLAQWARSTCGFLWNSALEYRLALVGDPFGAREAHPHAVKVMRTEMGSDSSALIVHAVADSEVRPLAKLRARATTSSSGTKAAVPVYQRLP